ncbi:hypothetical protein H3C61_04385 [Candidatus Gracilibacteria bacterium]|nr:hypothetical protein [Candidatus Gracilibacteria bacterium]
MQDLINEFESKLRDFGGEKVYLAREIQKIFGYDKWERFLGAINRTILKLDKKTIEENFFLITNKNTGGRPMQDMYLTLNACYFVLQNCDDRKQEVNLLKNHLKNLIDDQAKVERKINKIKFFDKVSIYLFLSFLVLLLLFYIQNYTNLLYLTGDRRGIITQNIPINEIKAVEKIVNTEFKKYDEKLSLNKNEIIKEEKNENIDYLKANILEIKDKNDTLSNLTEFEKKFNPRLDILKNITGENLIKSFFELGNTGLYRSSCSLLSPDICLSKTKGNLSNFANFWNKTVNGYNIESIKKVVENNGENIYCVTYNYKLKNDLSNDYIKETFNYTTTISNGYEQISKRFCEKITKGNRNLKCPFALKTYYCK